MSLPLSNRQLRTLSRVIGDGQDWPELCNDPEVNYVVDCAISGILGEDPEDYNEQLYKLEIEKVEELHMLGWWNWYTHWT